MTKYKDSVKYRTYKVWPIVCRDCEREVTVYGVDQMGEYPYSWQYVGCPFCGGQGVPSPVDGLKKKYPFPYNRTKYDYYEDGCDMDGWV